MSSRSGFRILSHRSLALLLGCWLKFLRYPQKGPPITPTEYAQLNRKVVLQVKCTSCNIRVVLLRHQLPSEKSCDRHANTLTICFDVAPKRRNSQANYALAQHTRVVHPEVYFPGKSRRLHASKGADIVRQKIEGGREG